MLREFVWLLSESEAALSSPCDALRLRRLFLRISDVKFGKCLWIGRFFHIEYPSNLVMGARCALGNFVNIENHALIVIGDDFIGSSGLTIGSGTHDPVTMMPRPGTINIGHRVWCGFNVTILAGVTIGDDVVIGAGSLVTQDIPSQSIAAGVPARVIKPLERHPDRPLWTWSARE
jgi:maltose O-acetyltransferase